MGDEAFTLGIRNAEVTMDYTSYEPVEPYPKRGSNDGLYLL